MRGRIWNRRDRDLVYDFRTLQRCFVIREGTLGLSVLVKHPYGRLEWLRRPGAAALSIEDALDAVAGEVLRRIPDAGERRLLMRLLQGPGPRWEVWEEEVKAACGRAAQTSRRREVDPTRVPGSDDRPVAAELA